MPAIDYCWINKKRVRIFEYTNRTEAGRKHNICNMITYFNEDDVIIYYFNDLLLAHLNNDAKCSIEKQRFYINYNGCVRRYY